MALTPPPGSTNGPVDMSVTAQMYVTEGAVLGFLLGGLSAASNLQTRLFNAEAQCEQQGQTTFSMLLSPLEQGLLIGALANVTCQFSNGLRTRLMAACTQKLASLGAPASF